MLNLKRRQMFSKYSCLPLSIYALALSSLAGCVDSSTNEPSPEQTSGTLSVTPSAAIQVGTAAELETIAASRGNTPLDISVVSSGVTAPGVITTVRAGFTEFGESLSDGIEQSWSFAQAPGTQGDLVIAVGVTGLDYVSTNAAGLLLRRTGDFDVRYSHGVWVQANGTRTPIAAVYTDGRILMTVPASLVAQSAYPAVLDPQIVVTPVSNVVDAR